MNVIQRELDPAFYGSIHLRENIIRICRDHLALTNDLNNASINVPDLINSLHTSITNYEAVQKSTQSNSSIYVQSPSNQDDQYFTDRQYRRGGYSNRRSGFRGGGKGRFRIPRFSKICFVCEKSDCWSSNHSQKKRDDSKKRFSDRHPQYKTRSGYDRRLEQYIADFEGIIISDSDDEDAAQYFGDLSPTSIPPVIDDAKLIEFESDELFLTSFGPINSAEFVLITSLLADKAFEHRITAKDDIKISEIVPYIYTSITESRYDDREFKGILVNCGAARRSTAGIGQFTALQRLDDSIQLDKSTAGSKIQFGIGSTSTMGTTKLNTPLGQLIFHIVGVNTPFLLCLVDLDRLGVYFNNLINELVQKRPIIIIFQTGMKDVAPKIITILQIGMKNPSPIILIQTGMKVINHSVIRRYGHAFLLWKILNQCQSLIVEFLDENSCYLTEVELRRLHRRFGHLSARRLHQILDRFGHDVEYQAIEHLIKFCHHCQMHEKSSDRFSFIIRDEDIQFNFNILVDILYIEVKTGGENKPVLHLVDEAIRFQAGR
jgi:hypothetical protein